MCCWDGCKLTENRFVCVSKSIRVSMWGNANASQIDWIWEPSNWSDGPNIACTPNSIWWHTKKNVFNIKSHPLNEKKKINRKQLVCSLTVFRTSSLFTAFFFPHLFSLHFLSHFSTLIIKSNKNRTKSQKKKNRAFCFSLTIPNVWIERKNRQHLSCAYVLFNVQLLINRTQIKNRFSVSKTDPTYNRDENLQWTAIFMRQSQIVVSWFLYNNIFNLSKWKFFFKKNFIKHFIYFYLFSMFGMNHRVAHIEYHTLMLFLVKSFYLYWFDRPHTWMLFLCCCLFGLRWKWRL